MSSTVTDQSVYTKSTCQILGYASEDTEFINTSFKNGSGKLNLTIEGELFMEPKVVTTPYGKNYSIGITVNEDIRKSLDSLEFKLQSTLNKLDSGEKKLYNENGNMFIKFRLDKDKKKFTTVTNMNLKPSKFTNDKICPGMRVLMDCNVSGWYNKSLNKYGLNIKPNKLFFGEEELVIKTTKGKKKPQLVLPEISDDEVVEN